MILMFMQNSTPVKQLSELKSKSKSKSVQVSVGGEGEEWKWLHFEQLVRVAQLLIETDGPKGLQL